MAMTPQELQRMDKLEKLVVSLLKVENVDFIKNLERRLNFISGTISLDDLSDVDTSGVGSGDVLKYNGSQWAPGTDNI